MSQYEFPFQVLLSACLAVPGDVTGVTLRLAYGSRLGVNLQSCLDRFADPCRFRLCLRGGPPGDLRST